MKISVVFALVAAIAGLVSSQAAVSMPSPVEKYEFVCAPGETVDSFANSGALATLGAIVPVNSDVLVCSSLGIGVQTTLIGSTTSNLADLPIMTSENSVAGLKNHFVEKQQTNGIGIEAFVSLPTNDGSDHTAWGPIITVGKASLEDAVESDSDKCFVWNNFLGGVDWQLFLHSDQVQVLSEEKFTCPRASFSDMSHHSPTSLTHLVWSQSESETQLFVNGDRVSHNPDSRFDTTLGVWNNEYAVHVLSEWSQIDAYPGVSPHFFSGTIHSLKIYDEPLDELQVNLAYQSGRDYFLDVIKDNLGGKMVATAWNNVTLDQDDTGNGFLSIGADSLVMDSSIAYVVEILSVPDGGYLTLLDGKTSVGAGTLLELSPGQTRTFLRYWSYTKESFTVPSESANGWPLSLPPPDSFEFRLAAFYSESNEVLLVSSNATQLVNIRNVNRPPRWEAVPTVVKQDPVSIDKSYNTPSALVSGGKLSDPDRNVLFVRVTITGVNGTVALNPQYLSLVIGCKSNIERSWQCTGEDQMGIPHTKLTFFAEPDDVKLILSDLRFTAFVPDTPGGIYLDAYDGINLKDGESDQCVDANDYAALNNKEVPSVSRECYNARAFITLEPGEIIPEEPTGLEKKLLGISYAAWIRYITYASLACCVFTMFKCCFSCVFGRRGRSGAEIDIEEGPDH